MLRVLEPSVRLLCGVPCRVSRVPVTQRGAGSGAGCAPGVLAQERVQSRSIPLSRRWLPRKRVSPFPVVVLRHFPVLMLSSQFLERQ